MYRVVRVPQVGWSDWGTKERILTSLQEIGKLDECLQRLKLTALENIQAKQKFAVMAGGPGSFAHALPQKCGHPVSHPVTFRHCTLTV